VFKKPSKGVLSGLFILSLLGIVAFCWIKFFQGPAKVATVPTTTATQSEVGQGVAVKSGDIIIPTTGYDRRGYTTTWATIIDPNTGEMYSCVLDNRAELRVIGIKKEKILLVVHGKQKIVGERTCKEGQDIFLEVSEVSRLQREQMEKLRMEVLTREENARNLSLLREMKAEAGQTGR
jgi:hypothetical protein